MAFVNLPPHGQLYEAEKRRLRREREQTSIDPVERYRLREGRLQDDLTSAVGDLIRPDNTIHYLRRIYHD